MHLYIFLHFHPPFHHLFHRDPKGAVSSSANSKVSLAGAVGNSKAPTSSGCRVDPWNFRQIFPAEKTRHQQKGATNTGKKHPDMWGNCFWQKSYKLKTCGFFVGTEGVLLQLATDVFRVFEALFMTRQIDTPSFVGFLH